MNTIDLKNLMAQAFEQDPNTIPDDAEINATAGWDSLAHINLMVQLQEQGVDMEPTDIPSLTTLPAIAAFLKERGFEVS